MIGYAAKFANSPSNSVSMHYGELGYLRPRPFWYGVADPVKTRPSPNGLLWRIWSLHTQKIVPCDPVFKGHSRSSKFDTIRSDVCDFPIAIHYGCTLSEIRGDIIFLAKKPRVMGPYQVVGKVWWYERSFRDTIPDCDRQANGRIDNIIAMAKMRACLLLHGKIGSWSIVST